MVVLNRVGLAAAVFLALTLVACVGDDTQAEGSPGVQGGSGPPPSSYDATVDGPGAAFDGGSDAPDARTPDAGKDATSGDANAPEASNGADAATSDGANADAGDAADGD